MTKVEIGDKITSSKWGLKEGGDYTVCTIKGDYGITATNDAESDGFEWFFMHGEYEVLTEPAVEYPEGLWYPWAGGSNPVHPLTTVNIITANNKSKWTDEVVNSNQCVWEWHTDLDHESDIVAFKVVKHYVEPPKDEDGRGPWVANTGEKPEVLDGQEFDIIMAGVYHINSSANLSCDFSLDHPYPVEYYRVVGSPVETPKEPREFWLYKDSGSLRGYTVNLTKPLCNWDDVVHVREVLDESTEQEVPTGWVENTGEAPEVPEGYTLDIKFFVGTEHLDTDAYWRWDLGLKGDYNISHYRLNPPK